MNNTEVADKDLINQAIDQVVSDNLYQGNTTAEEAVATQAEADARRARESDMQRDKDVLVAEMSAFVGGAALASTPTAGVIPGLGGAAAGFGLAMYQSEAVEEAGKTHMVGLAAAGGLATGVAAQMGNVPATVGIGGTFAAVALYQTGELVVSDIKNQLEAASVRGSQDVLLTALKGQPQEIVNAADKVLEFVARQTSANDEAVSERMDHARTMLAEQINNGSFARDLEMHQRAISQKNSELQL